MMATLWRWLPVALWMSLIFLFSSQLFSGARTSSWLLPLLSAWLPTLSGTELDMIHLALRKLGHWSEYFIFAVLLTRGLKAQWPRLERAKRVAWTVALATLYAASDEWHQAFVPNRSASAIDVLIDSLGAICGTFWTERKSDAQSAPFGPFGGF